MLDCMWGKPRQYIMLPDFIQLITGIRSGLVTERWESGEFKDWNDSVLGVCDEIGSRNTVSDAHYEILKKLIDLRESKPSVYISNLAPNRIAEVYDDRIASRLQGGTVIDMTNWPDRRIRN